MIQFSIIVPHFNNSKGLLKLLQSIPVTGKIEVIIVDDNSVDEEKKILLQLSKREDVKVYFSEINGGAGKARNIGMQKARGIWLIFADSDDYFSENFIDLIFKYEYSEADIVYFYADSVYLDNGVRGYRHKRYNKLIDDYLDTYDESSIKFYFTPPVLKLIKRDIVAENNIQFEEVRASNDIMFSIKVASLAKSIKVDTSVFYIITESANSLTNTYSLDTFDSKFQTALRANDFLRSIKMKKYQMSILYFLFRSPRFGLKYFLYVIFCIIKHRSNLLVGFSKVFRYKEVLNERENFFKS